MANDSAVGHRTGVLQPRRAESLDILRIVAAAAVFLFHARAPLQLELGPFDSIVASLDLGVFVFFALSGFLVFSSTRSGRFAVRDHLVLRTVRIFPAYLVALVFTLGVMSPTAYPGNEPMYLLMLHPMDTSLSAKAMPVAWSLHVEMAFYLALPAVAWLCGAATVRLTRPIVVIASLGALSLAARLAYPDLGDAAARVALAPMLAWAFVPGMLVAVALAGPPSFARQLGRRWVFVAGALLIVLPLVSLPNDHGYVELSRMIMVSTGTALMIPRLLHLRVSWRPGVALAHAGRTLSYPFYLWHLTLLLVIANMGGRGWTALALCGSVALVVSAVSWRSVERPTSDLARRLLRRTTAVEERPVAIPSGAPAG